MKEKPDLVDRMVVLEERLQKHAARQDKVRRLGCFLVVVVAVVVTANSWMLWRAVMNQVQDRLEHHFWVISQPGATGEQKQEAFAALVRAGNREWRSARLKHVKLREADLADVHLEMIDLEGCDLTDANLKSAILRRANLELAKLVRVDLSSADLSESFLRKVDLTEADLSRADLRSASLEQSDLIDANLERADLTETSLLLAVLTRADLTRANLSWANLDAADLTGADLTDANLEGVSIRDTFFGGCNWWRAKGLPSAVIERFKKEFPPRDEDSDELKNDYREWASD